VFSVNRGDKPKRTKRCTCFIPSALVNKFRTLSHHIRGRVYRQYISVCLSEPGIAVAQRRALLRLPSQSVGSKRTDICFRSRLGARNFRNAVWIPHAEEAYKSQIQYMPCTMQCNMDREVEANSQLRSETRCGYPVVVVVAWCLKSQNGRLRELRREELNVRHSKLAGRSSVKNNAASTCSLRVQASASIVLRQQCSSGTTIR
jgi:hypothetical protein